MTGGRCVSSRPFRSRPDRSLVFMVLAAATACVPAVLAPAGARAQNPAFVHVVRDGETLASIAQRYYGDPRRETVLVAENGLTVQGGAAIRVGMRLVIPRVLHHRVQEGDTWARLTERYYGDVRRTFLIIQVNDGSTGEQPDEGAELLVPYPLRHVSAQDETLRDIARTYYGTEASRVVRRIRRFNRLRSLRRERGQVVLVPLSDLVLSEEGRRIIEEQTHADVSGGDVRALQRRITEQLPQLREHVRRGRFTEAVALASRLIGSGELTGTQMVTIQRELGTIYVALGRGDLAIDAFVQTLTRQPGIELDAARTSPTVLHAFERARERVREQAAARAAQADAGAPDTAAP